MNNTFSINDLVKILNSLQLRDVSDSGSVVKSRDGDLIYTDEIAEAFGLNLQYADGNLKFVENN